MNFTPRRGAIAALIAATLGLTVTNGGTPCSGAQRGHGKLAACAPHQAHASSAGGGITYPDLSNNNPAYNAGPIARAGHPAEVLKVNQGTGFIDQTFISQVRSARSYGMAVGGYDFVSDYNAAEAYAFINRLHAAGMWRWSTGWLPPTLDVEYGNFSRAGLQHMIDILFREYGRVNIYTGAWYWTPHVGCWWPANVTGWISGYPSAPRICGMPAYLYTQHQYTDRGWNGAFSSDMNVWLGSRAQFLAFAHVPLPRPPKPRPKPAPRPAPKPSHAKEIAALRARRAVAEAELVKVNAALHRLGAK